MDILDIILIIASLACNAGLFFPWLYFLEEEEEEEVKRETEKETEKGKQGTFLS